MVEKFLLCEPLKPTTKAVDILNIVKEFFLNHETSLDTVGLLCNDWALAMLRNKSGFAFRVKRKFLALQSYIVYYIATLLQPTHCHKNRKMC